MTNQSINLLNIFWLICSSGTYSIDMNCNNSSFPLISYKLSDQSGAPGPCQGKLKVVVHRIELLATWFYTLHLYCQVTIQLVFRQKQEDLEANCYWHKSQAMDVITAVTRTWNYTLFSPFLFCLIGMRGVLGGIMYYFMLAEAAHWQSNPDITVWGFAAQLEYHTFTTSL